MEWIKMIAAIDTWCRVFHPCPYSACRSTTSFPLASKDSYLCLAHCRPRRGSMTPSPTCPCPSSPWCASQLRFLLARIWSSWRWGTYLNDKLLAVGKIRQFGFGMFLHDDHNFVGIALKKTLDLGAPLLQRVPLSIRLVHFIFNIYL
jgi:hypothetical protein